MDALTVKKVKSCCIFFLLYNQTGLNILSFVSDKRFKTLGKIFKQKKPHVRRTIIILQ